MKEPIYQIKFKYKGEEHSAIHKDSNNFIRLYQGKKLIKLKVSEVEIISKKKVGSLSNF